MSLHDDVLYLILLLASIGVGRATRSLAPMNRRTVSTFLGLIVLFLVSGIHGLHCLAAFALQVLLVRLVPVDALHVVSFGAQFLYLIFFRLSADLLPNLLTPYPPHTNAIQMILTLKMIGVAFEIHDSSYIRKKREKTKEDELQVEYKSIRPTSTDIFHYAFSHAGLLTGPYYRFRTFQDLYDSKYNHLVNCDAATWTRIQRIPGYIGLFLLSGYLFPLKVVEADGYYETTSFLYRLFYMTPVFFHMRMRLYTGFVLSECSCIMAGLGAYPIRSEPKPGNGPTKLAVLDEINRTNCWETEKFDFETVHNIDEYKAEFVPTMRESLKTWNMTVQYWLATIVYQRFPFRAVRTLAVMVVSSVWHGVHSGYYLSLGSVSLVLMVEDLYERILRRQLSVENQTKYDWISWFTRMQWFSYLGMAFQLLRIDTTMKFWHSILYMGHLVLPIFYLIGIMVVRPLFRQNS